MEEKNIIKEFEELENHSKGLKYSPIENGVEIDIEQLVNERHFNKDTVFESDIPIINFNGVKALSLGNFSVISGKPKAGKGFTLSLIIDGFINGNDVIDSNYSDRKKVVHIDTEQSGGHAQRLINTVGKLGGNNNLIDGYWFRGVPPSQLVLATDLIINKYHKEASIFIIDGIRDLSRTGVNDQEESTLLFNRLLHWTQEFNIHIIVVIHQNKADKNATGFLGGDMVKKAELHLSISKDKTALTHTIEAEDTRDAPISTITFMLDNDIKPVIIDTPANNSKKRRPEEYELATHKAALKRIFEDNKTKTTSELKDKIRYEFNIGDSLAKIFKEHYLNLKLIEDTGTGNKRQYSLKNEKQIFS